MRSDGSSLPPSWGSPWVRVACIGVLLVLLLCLAPPIVSGQSESNSRLLSIETSLTDSLSASAQLRQALKERTASRLDLEIAYAALREQLQTSSAKLQSRIEELAKQLSDSVTLSDDLQVEMTTLTALLIDSKLESEALSMAFDSYRAEMQGQVKGLECQVRGWKIVAISAGLLAGGLCVWAVVK